MWQHGQSMDGFVVVIFLIVDLPLLSVVVVEMVVNFLMVIIPSIVLSATVAVFGKSIP
jgi:hypothetical protein